MIVKPLVSVIILNWNGEAFLRQCLDSLLETKYPNIEILVVDNGSTDNSIDVIQSFSNVRLIKNAHNLGYAAGNNVGLKLAKGKYISTLNNDVVVDTSWLSRAVEIFEKMETVGVVGCRQMQYYDKSKIDGLYHTIDPFLSFPPFGWNQKYEAPERQLSGYVLSVNGGSAIYRKKMLEDIGLLDEHFYAYCEEVDLCLRGFYAGWDVVFVPSAVVYHMGGASFNKIRKRQLFLRDRNRLWLLYKNIPFWLLLERMPFLIIWELRLIRIYICKLRAPLLYLRSRYAAAKGFSRYKKDREKNMGGYKKRRTQFLMLKKRKYIPLFDKQW